MVKWNAHLEEPSPPDARARDVHFQLYSEFEAMWFTTLTMSQQLVVLRHHCRAGGWGRRWPAVARLVHLGGVNAPPNRLTPSQRTQQARMASHSSWARTPDPAQRTAPARRAFMNRFERQVDPDGTLEPQQRKQLAEHAVRAHMADLGLRSSRRRQEGKR